MKKALKRAEKGRAKYQKKPLKMVTKAFVSSAD